MKRRCRVCGCTEDNACVDDDFEPCYWTEDDLCSACDPDAQQNAPLVELYSEGYLNAALAQRRFIG